jgi:hypothetical protein
MMLAPMVPVRLLAAAAIAVLALAGCTRAPSRPSAKPTTATAADYFPLGVGNAWTYVDESPSLPPGARGARRTVRIVERLPGGWVRDSDRNELRIAGACVEDRVRRLLCGPLAAGTAWSSVVSVASTERYEIAAVGEKVATPAGTFEGAVRVRAHNRAGSGADAVLEITYAPGVGPVRIETWAVVEGKVVPQVRASLEAYRLEGK